MRWVGAPPRMQEDKDCWWSWDCGHHFRLAGEYVALEGLSSPRVPIGVNPSQPSPETLHKIFQWKCVGFLRVFLEVKGHFP